MGISDAEIREQLPHTLVKTELGFLGEKYEGKVRDSYIDGKYRYLITSDRLSCFDVVVTSVPFKGQVLNQLAVAKFKETEGIIENHLIDVPDPNVMVAKNCEIFPIEIIIRGYITGSAWRDYTAGKAVSGIELPKGLRESQRFETPIMTPSTKAEKGAHDEPISEEEILKSDLVEASLWNQAKEAAFALFERGSKSAEAQGLILVDTKYEFGIFDGKLLLADEIHTLDSSRYWVAETYQERFEAGEKPQMLDKEPTRQWLLDQGYKGEGPIPEFTDERRIEIARHYIDSFERIGGTTFNAETGNVEARLQEVLKSYSVAA